MNGLLKNGWVSNHSIDRYLHIIQTRFPRQNTSIHVSAYAEFLQERLDELENFGLNKITNWKGLNIVPCVVVRNHKGFHWVLLTIHIEKKEIRLRDPLAGKHQYQADILKKIHKTMTNEMDKTDEQRSQPWKKILELKHTHQQDGQNCGVFVSDWAEKMYKQG